MPRPIDAETKVKVQVFDDEHEEFITREMTVEEVLDAYTEEGCPMTVDTEPVRHGRWIKRSKVYPDFPYDSTYNYECSNCGYMDTHGANVEVPYCWHCGAKMDEVEDG